MGEARQATDEEVTVELSVQFEPEAMQASIERMMAQSPQAMYLTHYGRVGDVARLAAEMHEQIDAMVSLAQACDEVLFDLKIMDETLARVALDISGRPFLVWKVGFTQPRLGEMDTELFWHVFHSFAQAAGITLHAEALYGKNNHHIAETCFKAVARVLRAALERDPRQPDAIPSTKGSLKTLTMATSLGAVVSLPMVLGASLVAAAL